MRLSVGGGGRFALGLFMRHVMADQAADGRAGQSVVMGEMPGDAADDGALDAAVRLGGAARAGGGHEGEGENEGSELHGVILHRQTRVVTERPRRRPRRR